MIFFSPKKKRYLGKFGGKEGLRRETKEGVWRLLEIGAIYGEIHRFNTIEAVYYLLCIV